MAETMKSVFGRRGFIKKCAASATLAFLATGRVFAKSSSAQPNRYGVLVDMTRCIGCRRCESACNTINELPAPEIPFTDKSVFEMKRKLGAQTFTVVNRYSDIERLSEPVYRKSQCMHCNEPACVSACLVGAFKKTSEGPVIWDEKKCIGCRYCLNACPFYVPAYEYNSALTPKVRKCTMCYTKRISNGQVPACATECPVEALTFGRRNDLIKVAHERFRKLPDKYIESIYGENEAGGTGWLYIGPMEFEKAGLPMDIGTIPLSMYTKDFLTFVPLVLVVWPPLLAALHLFSRERGKQEKQDPVDLIEKDKHLS
jgi:formate dehydrogenase iron-sulfur subunit